ncbi:MAG: adenylyltransferase/cytidyltransferase family protein [Euryarchaeota archaeon]|nr:adenylyltransferase/cytidyltransferase family protein [Euryarchaeota archaeon]
MRVLTIGTFDLFHHGHERLLRRCIDLTGASGLVVALVNTDEFVERYKKITPARKTFVRIQDVASYVYPRSANAHIGSHSGETPGVIDSLRPDLIIIGSDWARKDYLGQLGVDQDWLDDRDIGVCYVPYTKGISSTMLRGS